MYACVHDFYIRLDSNKLCFEGGVIISSSHGVFEREIETSSNPRDSVMASGQVPGW